jgi:hypothetical protein
MVGKRDAQESPVTVSVVLTTYQINVLHWQLQIVWEEAAREATRLGEMPLTDEERRILLAAKKDRVCDRALAALQKELAWTVARDPAEAASP